MASTKSNIAHQLKLARQTKGWSLDKAREKTGVSKAMLGQIERGESSPTIEKLWQIATGFNLPLSYFLQSLESTFDAEMTTNAEEGNSIGDHLAAEALTVKTLAKFDETTKTEIFKLTLPPNYAQLSDAHNKGVIEHVLVISGCMECLVGGTWISLQTGEALKFDASLPHGYRNLQGTPAEFHNVICYTG